MLREVVDWIQDFLGVDDDVVTMGLTILMVSALAQIFDVTLDFDI